MSLKKLLARGLGGHDSHKPPGKDQHMMSCDTLLAELDFHIKELERHNRDQEMEARRMQTGVDYSWLVESSPKSYQMPQMDRLDLEELCYKVIGTECTQIISHFREAMSRDPQVEELPYIMRSCVKKVLDMRPAPVTFSDWVAKRTPQLSSFMLRPPGKIRPSPAEAEDIEMQSQQEESGRKNRAFSMPNFTVTVTNEGGDHPS